MDRRQSASNGEYFYEKQLTFQDLPRNVVAYAPPIPLIIFFSSDLDFQEFDANHPSFDLSPALKRIFYDFMKPSTS